MVKCVVSSTAALQCGAFSSQHGGRSGPGRDLPSQMGTPARTLGAGRLPEPSWRATAFGAECGGCSGRLVAPR